MGCLQLNNKEYKGVVVKMGNPRSSVTRRNGQQINSQNTNQVNGQSNNQNAAQNNTSINAQVSNQNNLVGGHPQEKEGYFISKSTTAIINIAIPVITILAGFLGFQVYILNASVAANNEKLNTYTDNFTKQISDIQKDVDDVNIFLNGDPKDSNDKGLRGHIAVIDEKLNTPAISATNNMSYSIPKAGSEPRESNYTLTSLSADTVVGSDTDGNQYLAGDLINETILLTYTEDDKEVYFLGQYNEDYRWNGYCVTNVYYLDGSFFGICESNFDNGKRLDYKTFYLSDSGEWILTDRICDGDENIGTSTTYKMNYDKIKNFTETNVRITDMIYIDKFLENAEATMAKYYCGKTSNLLFNDNTGNAYEVIYNDDGTVKTLYVGNFVDGYFNDSTGNAWDIAYAEKEGFYVYNTGVFKNGNAVKGSSTPISIDEINKIISNYNFDCELKWKQE